MGEIGCILVWVSGMEFVLWVMVEVEQLDVVEYWMGYLVVVVEDYFNVV